MATHANILAWRIPWTEESSWLQSMGSQRVRHVWNDLHTGNSNNPVVVLNAMKWFSSAQLLRRVSLSLTSWTAAHQASLSITNTWSLFKLMSIESVMPSSHLILCRPLLLPPSIFPSIRVFSNESVLHIRWPEYWSFNFSISPSSEYSWMVSFRMDWLALLAVQGTLKSLLQYHSSKHQFFSAQLSLQPNSHPYVTTGKTIALARWTFVGKAMSWLLICCLGWS